MIYSNCYHKNNHECCTLKISKLIFILQNIWNYLMKLILEFYLIYCVQVFKREYLFICFKKCWVILNHLWIKRMSTLHVLLDKEVVSGI